jgi:DNA-binding NtrC family response regulator
VLIVEDDPVVRQTFEHAVDALGVPFTAVEDGRQAIAELRKRDVGLVVLDLLLPGISGLRVLEWMSSYAEHVPVIVVTGADNSRAMVARFPNLVRVTHEKPLPLVLLRHMIAEFLGIDEGPDLAAGERARPGGAAGLR